MLSKSHYKVENGKQFNQGVCFPSFWWEWSSVREFWVSLLLQEPVKVSCEDPSVEKAVSSAVEKFNEKLTTGNKLALFQIQSASKVWDLNISVRLLELESGVKTYRFKRFGPGRTQCQWKYRTKAVQRLPRNSGMFGYFDLLVHTDGVFVMRLQTGSGADAVYSLQFTSRRSDCPAGGIKPWTDCDYLPRRKVMAGFHWWRGGDRRLRRRSRQAAELTAPLSSPRAQFHAAPSSTWQPLKWTQDTWNVRLVSDFKWKKSALNEVQL